jgi:hypothetical protein
MSNIVNMLNIEYIGRMPRYTSTIYPVKKVVSLTNEQAQRIRDYRFNERIESENEAIRRLIEAGPCWDCLGGVYRAPVALAGLARLAAG